MKWIFRPLVLAFVCVPMVTACSANDDEPWMPEFTIEAPADDSTLNMYIGTTHLKNTGIYLNEDSMLVVPEMKHWILELADTYPTLDQQPQRGSMTSLKSKLSPGKHYQIFAKNDVEGQYIRLGAEYLNVHADSWIYDKKSVVGAKLTYMTSTVQNEYLDSYCNDMKVYTYPAEQGEKDTEINFPEMTMRVVKKVFIDGAPDVYLTDMSKTLHIRSTGMAEGFVDVNLYNNSNFAQIRIWVLPVTKKDNANI